MNTIKLSKSIPALSKRGSLLAIGALAATGVLAGCGSSSNSIAPGSENPKAAAEAAQVEREEARTSTATTAASTSAAGVQTPKSGPLSKEPTVKPPSGPPPSKLVVKELVKGTGAAAKAGNTVTVNYVGVLYKSGKVFNASWEAGKPFPFVLGRGQVIPGWDKGVAGMKVGGRRELIIPAAEAYGKAGRPPAIPPNSALVFVVDLLAA